MGGDFPTRHSFRVLLVLDFSDRLKAFIWLDLVWWVELVFAILFVGDFLRCWERESSAFFESANYLCGVLLVCCGLWLH